MIKDRFIAAYIGNLRDEVRKMEESIAVAKVADLYELGRLQGTVLGLKQSLQLLESTLDADDE